VLVRFIRVGCSNFDCGGWSVMVFGIGDAAKYALDGSTTFGPDLHFGGRFCDLSDMNVFGYVF